MIPGFCSARPMFVFNEFSCLSLQEGSTCKKVLLARKMGQTSEMRPDCCYIGRFVSDLAGVPNTDLFPLARLKL